MNREFLGPAVFDGSRFVGLPLSGPLTASFGSTAIPQHAGGHTGVDIGAVVGTLVRAPAPGRVTAATESTGVFGTYVTLAHPGGFHTLYAHLSRLLVRAGQPVSPGDALGAVGMTGLTTGPHLHWGLALDGTPLQRGPHLRDPLAHLSAAPRQLDRERLSMAIAHGVFGVLQAAGSALDLQTSKDYELFPEGSLERHVLAIQRAASALIVKELRPGA